MQPLDHLLLARLPRPTDDSRAFWEGCNDGQLLFQHCIPHDHAFYYPRRLCPVCGADALRWQAASGRAIVYSFSEVHVPFQGPDWKSQIPYTVVLVDLAEGPRMLSRWLASESRLPRVGEAAQVVFPSVDGQKLPFFAPADEASA